MAKNKKVEYVSSIEELREKIRELDNMDMNEIEEFIDKSQDYLIFLEQKIEILEENSKEYEKLPMLIDISEAKLTGVPINYSRHGIGIGLIATNIRDAMELEDIINKLKR